MHEGNDDFDKHFEVGYCKIKCLDDVRFMLNKTKTLILESF